MSGRRVALVTGGSRGIGRATVLRLARDGYDVAFCHVSDPPAGAAVAREAEALGGRALAVVADVSDAEAVREFTARARGELGPIDLVVTCAGIVRDGPLVLMSDEDWRRVVAVDLDGAFNVCRSVLFDMVKRGSGCIVNVSSAAGVHGRAGQANYSAAKAGVIGFTEALAKEAGRFGVRANVVAPGFVETDMTAALTDRVREEAVRGIPLGRFGRPDEVADLIGYLARAEYVTGAVFQIDGGILV